MPSEFSPIGQFKTWQAPPAALSEARRLGWLNETTEEGLAWYRSQRGYHDARRAMDVLSGLDTPGSGTNPAAYRSHVNPNRLKKNVRQVVGTLSKLRPMWGYHSDNSAYKSQAEMFNKISRAWYLESFADRSIREALQYAAATARGWVVPLYRRDMHGTGRGDIKLLTFGAPCVLPYQLPATNDWQSAYAVTILDEMPVAMAHGMFPTFQHRLVPSSSKYWYANDGVRTAARGNVWQRIGRLVRGASDPALSDLLIPIRRTYVIDLSINTTGQPIPMGEPGSSWAYEVPFVGQEIPAGRDIKSGTPKTRRANENDARLYPYRRLLISAPDCIMYDGPGFDWHGMFPGISFCLDDWAWEPLGFSLTHDGYEINEAIKELVRGNIDKARAQLDMSLAYDTNAVASHEAKAFDPMQPRGRIGFDGNALEGMPFQPVVPPDVLKIAPESIAMIEYLEQTLDGQLAVADAMTLARMRTVGSMDELEKIMEAQGPIIEDISRTMEPPMRDLGVMVKYLIMQWYNVPRVMQYVGADGITPVVIDFNPASLIPSHMPGEDPEAPSMSSPIQRARAFADNLRFFILPHSLHEMSQMVMKLGLIQLRAKGITIDSQTIADSWNVPNFGTLDGNTVIEKYWSEQEQQLIHAAKMQTIAASEGLLPPPGAASGGAPPGAPKPGGGAPEGRPSTEAAPPKLESRAGGERSTIATSQ